MSQDLGQLLIGIGVDINELKQDVKKAKRESDKMANNAEKSAKKARNSLSSMLGGLAIGATMAKLGKDMLVMSADFQKSMQNVSTLISGDATPAINELRSGILEMSKRLPKTPNELGASAYDIFSAGVTDASDALKVLESSARLSMAGLGTQAQSVDLMTSAINAFGLEAKDSEQVASILFTTVKQGKTTVGDMASQFGRVASAAAGAGVTLKDMQAQLAALTVAGLPTSQAQTSLAQAFIETTKGGNAFAVALKDAKISQEEFNTTIKEKGFVEALQDVRDKLKLSNEEFKKLIGSSEASGAIFTLLTSQNEKYTETLKQMETGYGDFANAVEINNQGLEVQLKNLSSAWESYNITIMDATGGMSIAEAAVGTLTETVLWLSEGSWGTAIANHFDRVSRAMTQNGGIIRVLVDGYKVGFSEAGSYAQELYNEVKKWVVDKMKNLPKLVKDEVISPLITNFKRGYDVIVGHSIVPDMVKEIGSEMDKLPSLMVDPTNEAVDETMKSFERLSRGGLGSLAEFTPTGTKEEKGKQVRAGGQLNDLLGGVRGSTLDGLDSQIFQENELYARQLADFKESSEELLAAKKISQEQIDSWQSEIDMAHQMRLQMLMENDMAAEMMRSESLLEQRRQNMTSEVDLIREKKEEELELLTKYHKDTSGVQAYWAKEETKALKARRREQVTTLKNFATALGASQKDIAKLMIPYEIAEGTAALAKGLGGNPAGFAEAAKHFLAAKQWSQVGGGGGGSSSGGGGGPSGDPETDTPEETPIAEALPARGSAKAIIDLGRLDGQMGFVNDFGEVVRNVVDEISVQNGMNLDVEFVRSQ